jgi:hypothetical protein
MEGLAFGGLYIMFLGAILILETGVSAVCHEYIRI